MRQLRPDRCSASVPRHASPAEQSIPQSSCSTCSPVHVCSTSAAPSERVRHRGQPWRVRISGRREQGSTSSWPWKMASPPGHPGPWHSNAPSVCTSSGPGQAGSVGSRDIAVATSCTVDSSASVTESGTSTEPVRPLRSRARCRDLSGRRRPPRPRDTGMGRTYRPLVAVEPQRHHRHSARRLAGVPVVDLDAVAVNCADLRRVGRRHGCLRHRAAVARTAGPTAPSRPSPVRSGADRR